MPALTIGRMAKLYGLHRSTLHEAVAKGRISSGLDGKGQRVIELAEMIRVYGEPETAPTPPDRQNPTLPYTSAPTEPDTSPTPVQMLDVGDIKALQEELRLLRAEVKDLRETLLCIEHKPEIAPSAPAGPSPARRQSKHKPESFADLLKGLDEES
ncbi:hypothetical protein [Vibrio sp. HB161653]|uniref:hypothetical protein n=1 Tax=Vibrio sp. HB161653 TaxID=3068274 RepID=UPI00273FE56C|nr:hypothetical protein [Vibrio sp. HB161653]MDP5255843.1 hypothetical protein [Vibrio sp. HB161653]